jgi:transposase
MEPSQAAEVQRLVASGRTAQKVALRGRIVLLAAQGLSNQAIATQLGTSRPTVLLWRRRFTEQGVAGVLRDAHKPGRPKTITSELVARVVEETLHTTPPDATHWSTRSMAKRHGVSRDTVQRIWKQHGLQPHRVERFKLSRDPRFVEKVRDVVGLYLNPPQQALVLSVDEKSQTQALDRTQPVLPLRPGIPARQTHDYIRHGTTTLFAALNVLDGKVIGQCLPRHRAREFVRFLRRIDNATSPELALHLIVDNSSTHKTPLVKAWLKRHPRFHFHFTPTSASWLNLVERFFAEITPKRIRRGTFTSLPQLVRAIGDYLDHHNQAPKPFTWTQSADMILAKVERCKEHSRTAH